jgi:MFS family permease
MSSPASIPEPQRLTATHWLICIVAAIGFAFDIYELLMLPLILRPALLELANVKPGTPEFEFWRGMMFFVPALVGGVFGMVGGYLTDLLGRRRVLVWSILLYAFSALAAGFSTSLPMLLFFRCTTFIGVCVEFVAAVAWLAELFPNPKQREAVLGYTQAFSSVGGLLVTGANMFFLHPPEWAQAILPEIMGGREAWRYTLISGVIPALPLIIIRPFMPESPAWAKKKEAGTLKRPSVMELFSPTLRRTTIVTTIMFACSYGAAFGALQHTPFIVPGLPEVREMVEGKPVPEQKQIEQLIAAKVNTFQEVGGLVGRFLLAALAVVIVSRRGLLRLFQVPGLIVLPLLYLFPARDNLTLLQYGIFFAGLLTVAQFSFWGNYLPRVYPVHLRGTGESFAANVGGRMFGTSAAFVTTQLSLWMPGSGTPGSATFLAAQTAMACAIVGFAVYFIGFIASFFLPEPPEGEIAD